MACTACREPLWQISNPAYFGQDAASPSPTLSSHTRLTVNGLIIKLGVCGAAQVQRVLEWTSAVGVDLLAGKPGPHGLTALHVAAVMQNGAALAALLTGAPLRPPSSFPGGCLHVPTSAQCFEVPPSIEQQLHEAGIVIHAPSRLCIAGWAEH